jgi:hypothetical protein
MASALKAMPAQKVSDLTLREAVRGEAELGLADPWAIADSVLEKYDQSWLVSAFLADARTILHEYARLAVSHPRRDGAATAHDRPPNSEKFLRASILVPGRGYTIQSEMTRDDCIAVAGLYRGRALAMTETAERFDRCAEAMKKQLVKRLGDVRGLEELL